MARVPSAGGIFFKFQSMLTRNILDIQQAFPTVPWVFLYRNAVENMVSNLRGSGTGGPCLRYQENPPPELLDILPAAKTATPERYCAAYIAHLRQFAMLALGRAGLSPKTGRSTGAVLNYNTLPGSFLGIINDHYGITLADSEVERINAIATLYSKARKSGDRAQEFAGDSVEKQQTATPAMLSAAKEFTDSLNAELDKLSFGAGRQAAAKADSNSTASELVSEPYPRLFSLKDILTAWNPDDITVPASYPQYNSLREFDFSDPVDLALATKLREAELPFVIRNVPNLNEVSAKWTVEYLEKRMQATPQRVEKSATNHFMFYRGGGGDFKAPTESARMTYSEWRQALADHEAAPATNPYVYLTVDSGRANAFVAEDLTMFENKKSFFIVDPNAQAGIHCRFGMPGIIAEAHWDSGRNFIAVIQGTRRYIISPPGQCNNLFILKSGPSARHSDVDWSDPAVIPKFANATAFEVVLTAGDILYLPALWFHYIISLTENIQCNTRSGTPDVDVDGLHQCDMYARASERNTVEKVTGLRKALPSVGPITHRPIGGVVPIKHDKLLADSIAAKPVTAAVDAEIEPDYPKSFLLQDILTYWNPDVVDIPADYGKYSSLKRFDYATDLDIALKYRDAELPFVIHNVPNLEATAAKWSDEYLTDKSRGFATRVEASTNNHFMYYNSGGKRQGLDTPTKPVKMTFPEWREAAHKVEANLSAHEQLYYMTMTGYSGNDVSRRFGGWIAIRLAGNAFGCVCV